MAPERETPDAAWLEEHAASSLRRLMPRLEARFASEVDAAEWEAYADRLRRHFAAETNEHLIARAVQTGFLV